MTVSELEKKLDKIVDDFADCIKSQYTENSTAPIDEGDLVEVAKQVQFSLIEFKSALIKYLDES